MKISKLFTISLLAGSLLLSSCDMLTPKRNRSRSNGDDTSLNYQSNDYQGKKGASELSRDEWEKAFNLKDTLFNRSVTVSCSASSGAESMVMNVEIDHGNMKAFESQGTNSRIMYVRCNDINAAGYVTGEFINDRGNASYDISSFTAHIDELMAEFGILEYRYDKFQYNSKTAQYESEGYEHHLSTGTTTIEIADASIEIKDGLPNKVVFSFDSSDTKMTYVSTYSKYGQTNVKIPNTNDAGDSNNQNVDIDIERPNAEKITFEAFSSLCYLKVHDAPNYNYVTVNGEVRNNGKLTEIIDKTAILRIGLWQSISDNSFTHNDVKSLIMDEENLYNLTSDKGATYEFYVDNKASDCSYIYFYDNSSSLNFKALITLNLYFHVIKEEIIMDRFYEKININWDMNDEYTQYPTQLMGRKYIGYNVDGNFANYNQAYDFVQNCKIMFDYDNNYYFSINNGATLPQLDKYDDSYGCFTQSGKTGSMWAKIGRRRDESGYEEISSEDINLYTYSVDVEDLYIYLHTDYGTLIFAYSEPADGYVDFPDVKSSQSDGDFKYFGHYTFENFEYTVSSESLKEEAIACMKEFNCDNDYFYLEENGNAQILLQGQFLYANAFVDSVNGALVIDILYYVDQQTYEMTPAENGDGWRFSTNGTDEIYVTMYNTADITIKAVYKNRGL